MSRIRARPARSRTVAVLAASLLAAGSAHGQNVPPRFEVASIKPGGDVFSTRPLLSRGRIRWTTQLAYLIGYAYRLAFTRVSGSHLDGVYSVEATFDPAAADGQVRLMIQTLLAERFKMRAHRVTTEAEGYALAIAKGGSKVKESAAAGRPDSEPGLQPAPAAGSFVATTLPGAGVLAVKGRNASIAQLASALQRVTKVPIWDRTGLTGNYDFEFRYALDPGPEAEADAPSLATALRDNLGLTLKKQKGPLETLVIDRIQEPSEN
jgi:uncharacterized protein (TIGR03435 family)